MPDHMTAKMNAVPLQPACAFCGKSVNDNGFARIHDRNGLILLCSPKCALSYFGSRPGPDPTRDKFVGQTEVGPNWYDLDASLSEGR